MVMRLEGSPHGLLVVVSGEAGEPEDAFLARRGAVVVIADLWAAFIYVFPPKKDGEGSRDRRLRPK